MESGFFAKNLKHLRKEKGISQVELAELVGKKQNTITTWESGKHEPDFESLRRIIDFLDVPVDKMLFFDLSDAHPKQGNHKDKNDENSTPKRTPNSTPKEKLDLFQTYKDASKEQLITTIGDLRRNITALEKVINISDIVMNELRDQLADCKRKIEHKRA